MASRSSHVLLTLAKELRETLRDRRTIAIMILFPLVVYPLLALMVSQVFATREKEREARPSRIAVSGTGETADDLRRRIRARTRLFTLISKAQAADVEAGRLDALLLVRPDADAPAEPDSPPAAPRPLNRRVEVVFDAARDDSRVAAERAEELLASALPPECAPLDVKKRDLASRAKLGGYLLSKVLPLAVILMVLLGAFYPAIDVTAGERERGTLETVLTAPVHRFDLLLGKVLAVAVIAATTGLLNLISMTVTLIHAAQLAEGELLLPVPWGRAAAGALVVLPAAFLFGSVFVAIGSVAKGFKEAQNLLMPVYFMAIAPALLGAVGEYSLTGLATLVPAMNVTLLARDLVLGQAALGPALAALGSTALYGALALLLAARIYDSERFVDPASHRHATADSGAARTPLEAPPSAGDALGLFAIAFVLLYFVFLPWQKEDLVSGLLASQWLGMFGLVVALARLRKRPLAAFIALRPPPPSALLGAALVGASAWGTVALISERLVPVPPEVLEQLRRALLTEGQRPFALNLILIALTPAICEEVLFRGVVLRGLGTRVAPVAAAVVTGLLFGLFHLDVFRLLPSTILGILISFVALWSGSLLPAMLAHFLNNAILLALATARVDERLGKLGPSATVGLLTVSLTLTTIGLLLTYRSRRVT